MSRSRFLLGAFLVAALSCARQPEREGGVELRHLFDEAERWTETSRLDLGSAREAALLGGWSAPSSDGGDFLWLSGESSEIELRRADDRAFRIRLRGWSHPRAPEGQEVFAALNGASLGSVRFGADPVVATIEVPAGTAVPGLNRLAFTCPVQVPTGKYGRPLGAAIDAIAFDSAEAAAPSSNGGAIEIDGGSGIDLFVELGTGAELILGGVDEEGGARLAVDVGCEGEPGRYGLRRSPGVALRESGSSPALCRLTLRAAPGDPGKVRIGEARLHRSGAEASTNRNAPPAAAAPGSSPSFVICLVDALRADHVGAYGAAQPLTPAVDRFAANATVFENARAQSSWTRPAVASLFTGLTPLRHAAVDIDDRLPDETLTLAERLRERGYRTAYLTANGNTAPAFGFDQGIDFFRWLAGTVPDDKVRWRAVHAAAREFLDSLPPAAPFLLVIHTVETHAPYRPSPPHRQRWAKEVDPALGEREVLVGLPSKSPEKRIVDDVARLYAAETADADEGFADLLAEIERRGLRTRTSVLFTSDHGEELFEHGGVEHGRTLYEEQLRIPLVWSVPGSGGRRIATPIDQVDVLPTILELAGLAPDPALPGRSFAAALRGGSPPTPRASAAWLDRLTFHQESIVDGDFKLIRDFVPRSRSAAFEEMLFDLVADPRELRLLDPPSDLRKRALRARLRGWAVRSGAALSAPAAELDERLREELRALGYIQ